MVVNSNHSSSLHETTAISCSTGQRAVQPSLWGKTGDCLHLWKAISSPHPRELKSFSLYVTEVLLPSSLSGSTVSSFLLCFMPEVDSAISPLPSPHRQEVSTPFPNPTPSSTQWNSTSEVTPLLQLLISQILGPEEKGVAMPSPETNSERTELLLVFCVMVHALLHAS